MVAKKKFKKVDKRNVTRRKFMIILILFSFLIILYLVLSFLNTDIINLSIYKAILLTLSLLFFISTIVHFLRK
jgi:O-antigen/teichoic acid export membrane protein